MNLDRFVLVSPSTPPTSSVPSSTPASTPGTPSASSGSPGASVGPSDGISSPPSHSKAGPIAGGVVGGLAALAILAALLWFFLWRKRKQLSASLDMNGGDNPYEPKDDFVHPNPVMPFILSSPPQGPMQSMQSTPMTNSMMSPMTNPAMTPMMMPADLGSQSGPSASGSSEYGGGSRPLPVRSDTSTSMNTTATATPARPVKGARQMSADPVVRASDAVVTSPSVYPASSEYSGPTATSLANTVSPRREQDAGFLQGDDLEEEPETLPPDYHAATANPRTGQE